MTMRTTHTKKEIFVFADWHGLKSPTRLGILNCEQLKGKEVFSFEYDATWLSSGFNQMLDPDLQMYSGAYFPKNNKTNFGMFMDSCPDRWGRVLMQRREAILARLDGRSINKLSESDYLLGVYDEYRMGGLRFKLNESGSFLNDNKNMAAPPWTSLRELEAASLSLEEENIKDKEMLKWIELLIAPGSSLGGARPKASAVDYDGHLWIAKFPSIKDDKDIGAWEMVVNELAQNAGLNTAQGMLKKFNNRFHTYLSKRFDRSITNERIHFQSAMTALGYQDGENASNVSYLEIAEFIIKHSFRQNQDLEELWRRIVFSIAVKNTDDHLRNHGFLLSNKGWQLSPAYDINPNEYGTGLSINISENDNSLSIDLALEVAGIFRISVRKAKSISNKIKTSVSEWNRVALKYKIGKSERDRLANAFE